MLILLTNDDGIQAPGLLAMYRELVTLGEVRVIAPEAVQSNSGHGVTMSGPLLTSRVSIEHGFDGIAVAGSPADCVKLAIARLMPRRPDLVVSGINAGANVGINVLYSGTVAAAIEAAFLGLPSIAVSLYLRRDVPTDYARAARWARQTIEQLRPQLQPGQVANINLPAIPPDREPTATRIVRQCTRPWSDEYDHRTDPRGRDYFWYSSVFKLNTEEDDTDVAALRDGCITVTPLQFDLTDRVLIERWDREIHHGDTEARRGE